MRGKLFIFVAGLVLGCLAMAAVYSFRSSAPSSVTPTSDTPAAGDAAKELAKTKSDVQRLENQNAELVQMLTQLAGHTNTASTSDAASKREQAIWKGKSGDGSDTNRAAGMDQMIKAAMQQQIDMKISAMKLRLKLSDDQEQSIRALLDKQFAAADVWSKMMKGKVSKEDVSKQNAAIDDYKAQIKDLLSPEQQSEYDKVQVEERQTQAQMVANVELLQLQSMLQLTQSQQDQVFQILYQQAEQSLLHTDGGTRIPMDWEKIMEAKKESLRGVLTPEQFQSYEKYIAGQMEMYKAILPASDGSNTTTAGTSIQSGP